MREPGQRLVSCIRAASALNPGRIEREGTKKGEEGQEIYQTYPFNTLCLRTIRGNLTH